MQIFAKKLRFLMEQNNVQNKELAILLGVGSPMISRYLKGDRMPQTKKLAIIANRFNVSLEFLLEKEEKDNKDSLSLVQNIYGQTAVELLTAFSKLDAKGQSHVLGYALGYLKCETEQKKMSAAN